MERRVNLLHRLRKPAALPCTYAPRNRTSQVSLPNLVPPPNPSGTVADPNPSSPRVSLPNLVPPPSPLGTVADPNPSSPRVSLPSLVPPPSPRALTLSPSPSPPLRPRSIPLEEPLPDLHPFGPQDFDLARYFREHQGSAHRLMFVVEKRSPQEPMRVAYQQEPNQQHDELATLRIPSPVRWGGQLVLAEPHTETTPPTISVWPLSSTYRQLIPREHLPELFDKVERDLRLRTFVQRGDLKVIPPTKFWVVGLV